MPALKNARDEAYCQFVAKGSSARAAYELAGFKPNRGNANRKRHLPQIDKRIREIIASISEKAEWGAVHRLKMLAGIADATQKKDPRSAIAAISEANKMQGSYAPSQHRHSGPNGGPIPTVDLTNVSDDDLARLERIFGPLAGPGDDDAADQGGEGAEE